MYTYVHIPYNIIILANLKLTHAQHNLKLLSNMNETTDLMREIRLQRRQECERSRQRGVNETAE